jgi:hypothetical protein
MLTLAQYHTIPLPKGWPRRVRSAVIQVIPLARVSRRITPSRGRTRSARHRLVSLVHYTPPKAFRPHLATLAFPRSNAALDYQDMIPPRSAA